MDLPGIIEGAKDGKGRGRQVIAVARTASLIFIGNVKNDISNYYLENNPPTSWNFKSICHLLWPIFNLVLDVLKPLQHKRLLEKELEGFGIRLNKDPPQIGFRKKEKGGINLQVLCQQSELDIDLVIYNYTNGRYCNGLLFFQYIFDKQC